MVHLWSPAFWQHECVLLLGSYWNCCSGSCMILCISSFCVAFVSSTFKKVRGRGEVKYLRVRAKMMETSIIEIADDIVGSAKVGLALLQENFSAVLNWICQAGTSPGIAVSTPAFASQQDSDLWRGDLKCLANAVWTGESALKCLLDLVVMAGHFLLLSQVGTFGHVSSTQVHCVPWAACVVTAGIFFLVKDYVCAWHYPGKCLHNLCSGECIWSDRAFMEMEDWNYLGAVRGSQEFHIPLHRSFICLWKHMGIVEESKS